MEYQQGSLRVLPMACQRGLPRECPRGLPTACLLDCLKAHVLQSAHQLARSKASRMGWMMERHLESLRACPQELPRVRQQGCQMACLKGWQMVCRQGWQTVCRQAWQTACRQGW